MNRIQIYGIVFVLLGFFLRYMMNRRRFKRKNKYAVQEWETYEKKTVYLFLESVVRFIGLLLILFGIYLFGMEMLNKYLVQHYWHK